MLTLVACSSDSEPETTQTPGATPETTTTDATTTEEADATAMESTDSDLAPVEETTVSEITVTVGGADTVITPHQVYCSGEEGGIRHIIGKTNNQPPLIEATPDEFAMVKLTQEGAPYKAEKPEGITFSDTSASFDGTVLGDATVDGTLVCTVWED